MSNQRGLAADWRRGSWVLLALIGLTVVEFLLLLVDLPIVLFRLLLLALNLADAGLIAYYFMHLAQLWRGE
jgi:hypothetical protein